MLIEKSNEHNIDLNAKDIYGCTAFISACMEDHPEIAEMIICKSIEWNIKLNTKDISNITARYYRDNPFRVPTETAGLTQLGFPYHIEDKNDRVGERTEPRGTPAFKRLNSPL